MKTHDSWKYSAGGEIHTEPLGAKRPQDGKLWVTGSGICWRSFRESVLLPENSPLNRTQRSGNGAGPPEYQCVLWPIIALKEQFSFADKTKEKENQNSHTDIKKLSFFLKKDEYLDFMHILHHSLKTSLTTLRSLLVYPQGALCVWPRDARRARRPDSGWRFVAVSGAQVTYQWQILPPTFNPALFILSHLWLMPPVRRRYWFMGMCPDVLHGDLCFYLPPGACTKWIRDCYISGK